MRRLLLLIPAVFALAVAVAPAAYAAKPRGAAKPRIMLPDIDQAPVGCPGGYKGDPTQCRDWDVCMVADASDPNAPCQTDGPIQAVRLRFTSSEDNVGDGPLLIYARRAPGAARMRIRQAFALSNGTVPGSYAAAQRAIPDPSADYVYYEPALAHRHWHLQNFEHFQLRSTGGAILVKDVKNGVCLGDRYTAAAAGRLKNVPVEEKDSKPLDRLAFDLGRFDPRNPPNTNNCHHLQTPQSSLRELREGISVGAGDDYDYQIDYQWLDITHVPSGNYLVVNQANADRALREKRYSNDAASMLVSIQWPDGAAQAPDAVTAAPTVTMLNNCPDTATCAPRTSGSRARVRAQVAFGGPLGDEASLF